MFLMRAVSWCYSSSLPLLTIFRYDPGGSKVGTWVFWRVPIDRHTNELITTAALILQQIKSMLPIYHTRQMRQQFARKVSFLGVGILKHILRTLYSDLTMDASAPQNPAIEERVKQVILSEDPDLITNLRKLNKGRPDDTFKVFFNKLEERIKEVAAADERRQGVEHLSTYLSIRDMIEQVSAECPEGTNIPSKRNCFLCVCTKQRLREYSKALYIEANILFTIQTRQLRASYIDQHYCAALFKYLRTFAVKYRSSLKLLCIDDKSKIDFGEQGCTFVRCFGKEVDSASLLDFRSPRPRCTKQRLITTICCTAYGCSRTHHRNLLSRAGDSLSEGLCLSTQQCLPSRYGNHITTRKNGDAPLILVLYSDGGPDHRLTYSGVQLSLIIMFNLLTLIC